jgi:hypothetical protein
MLGNLLGSLVGPVASIIEKAVPDKDLAAKLAHEVAVLAEKQAHEAAMAQVEVNKAEASHRSVFVAGWRPFIGWTCGVALCYHFVAAPVILFGVSAAGLTIPELPAFDMDSLMTVLLGMLGLGGMRTFEKAKGLAK